MNSTIKPKKGYCTDCKTYTFLIAKRCEYCYKKFRAAISAKKPKQIAKAEKAKVIGTFFANQTLVMPLNCEECGNPLPKGDTWMRRAAIAHILPKREEYGFPSVAIHPQNKIFLCIDCHTDFDNRGREHVLKMKSLPIMKERVKALLPHLTPKELNKVPDYFH